MINLSNFPQSLTYDAIQKCFYFRAATFLVLFIKRQLIVTKRHHLSRQAVERRSSFHVMTFVLGMDESKLKFF